MRDGSLVGAAVTAGGGDRRRHWHWRRAVTPQPPQQPRRGTPRGIGRRDDRQRPHQIRHVAPADAPLRLDGSAASHASGRDRVRPREGSSRQIQNRAQHRAPRRRGPGQQPGRRGSAAARRKDPSESPRCIKADAPRPRTTGPRLDGRRLDLDARARGPARRHRERPVHNLLRPSHSASRARRRSRAAAQRRGDRRPTTLGRGRRPRPQRARRVLAHPPPPGRRHGGARRPCPTREGRRRRRRRQRRHDRQRQARHLGRRRRRGPATTKGDGSSRSAPATCVSGDGGGA